MLNYYIGVSAIEILAGGMLDLGVRRAVQTYLEHK